MPRSKPPLETRAISITRLILCSQSGSYSEKLKVEILALIVSKIKTRIKIGYARINFAKLIIVF
jgi:hypothetical protein